MKALLPLALAVTVSLSGCAAVGQLPNPYALSDEAKVYCESTSPAVRDKGRELAREAGITLPDLCAAYHLGEGGVHDSDAD